MTEGAGLGASTSSGNAIGALYPCMSKSSHRSIKLMIPLLAAGVLLSKEEVERAAQLCQDAGAWLIMDNTYEHFVYDGRQHHCIAAPQIIHIFSFSKVPAALALPCHTLDKACACKQPHSVTYVNDCM